MLKAGTETGSLDNHLYSRVKGPEPKVGMGVTILGWTDRFPGTIVRVTPKTFTVREDKATRIDHNGMSENQQYTYESDHYGRTHLFRMTKRGYRSGTYGVLVGMRDKYHDYSF